MLSLSLSLKRSSQVTGRRGGGLTNQTTRLVIICGAHVPMASEPQHKGEPRLQILSISFFFCVFYVLSFWGKENNYLKMCQSMENLILIYEVSSRNTDDVVTSRIPLKLVIHVIFLVQLSSYQTTLDYNCNITLFSPLTHNTSESLTYPSHSLSLSI